MKQYAMYLRKSRADIEAEALGEMETLARHEKILTELAKRQGLNVVAKYKEIVSGESIQDRPQMQKLLEDVYTKMYDGVLVMEVERLARGDTRDQGIVAEAFKYSNTLIITPVKTYDPNNQYDEEYFEFGLFMSRREYKTIQRRLMTGKLQAIKEGNYMGSLPPYGYDIDKRGRNDRTLKLNDQSKYVEMMFNWFVNDRMSSGEIAKQLTAMHVPTRTGKPEWNRATVKDILQNNLYTGKIRWYRRKRSKEFDDGVISKKKRRQVAEDYLIVDGKHPAIVSEELFDKAQTLFTGQVPVKANETIVNPFARLLFCKHCGKAIAYQSYAHKKGNTAPRYVHRESTICNLKSTSAQQVTEAVIQALQLYIADFKFKMTNEAEQAEAKHHAEIIESMQRELEGIKIQRAGLFDKLERGIYTDDEFLERKTILTQRIESIEAAILEQKKNEPAEVDYEEKIIKFSECVEMLKNPDIDGKTKNDFLKEIVSRIEYDVKDLGRNKGAEVYLDVYLKD